MATRAESLGPEGMVSDGRVGGVRFGDIPIAGWFISYISIHFMENPIQIKEN